MKNLINISVIAACLLSPLLSAFADKYDDEANRARNQKGTTVLRTSPGGRVQGTIKFEDACKKATRGTVIHMLPGFYNPQDIVAVDADGVIIEGDGNGYCDTPIYAYGKNTIFRNLHARSLEGEDFIAVDCKVNSITVTTSNAKNTTLIYNCAMNRLFIYPSSMDIMLKYSTIVRGDIIDSKTVVQSTTYGTNFRDIYAIIGTGDLPKGRGELNIDKSIVYSQGFIFDRECKLMNLEISDSVIYAGHGQVKQNQPNNQQPKAIGFKDAFQYKQKGDIITQRPLFVKEPTNTRLDGWVFGDKSFFVLKDNSPGYGKDYGVFMGDNGMPVPNPNLVPDKK